MLWWLAENTVFAAILAGFVVLICRCFRPGPAVQHALWLVVLVKLLTPPLIEWPWALPGIGYPSPTGPAADAVTLEEEGSSSVWEVQTILTVDAPSSAAELLPAPQLAAEHGEE